MLLLTALLSVVAAPCARQAAASVAGTEDQPRAGHERSGDEPGKTAPGRARARDDDDDDDRPQPGGPIVVTARRLDAARTAIEAGLGATSYSLTNDAVENRPGGETGNLADILAQAPGVTISGGALFIRGARADQVRVNDVIIPEAVADPAERLSARLAETTRLLTGTLPAQFGSAPAGVISVTTKNGLYEHGGQAELFAGSDGLIEPAVEWAGSVADTSLFASASLERDRTTRADAAGLAARDRRIELGGLGFADHLLGGGNRVSLILGGSHARDSVGATSIAAGSEATDEGYAVGAFQHSTDRFTLQASLLGGVASDRFDFNAPTGDRRGSFGTQVDARQALGTAHTLRFGVLATRSTTREQAPDGDRLSAGRTSAALYVQDEWKLADTVTLNPGLRAEWLRGFGSGVAWEPRASLVWAAAAGVTTHAGYARFAAAAPPDEEAVGAPLPDERDDYYDAGVQRSVGALTLGLDGYLRSARHYLATRETPGSALRTAFAFRRARIRGVELSATYARRGATAWANLSLASARARTIEGGQALFAPETLAGASARAVPLAGDWPVTVSGGFTRRFDELTLSGDVIVSSGAVRTIDPFAPDAARRPTYGVIGLAVVYHLRIADRPADLRLDLTNLTNARYATSDATGLEGGWTREGRGRAVTVGIEQGF